MRPTSNSCVPQPPLMRYPTPAHALPTSNSCVRPTSNSCVTYLQLMREPRMSGGLRLALEVGFIRVGLNLSGRVSQVVLSGWGCRPVCACGADERTVVAPASPNLQISLGHGGEPHES